MIRRTIPAINAAIARIIPPVAALRAIQAATCDHRETVKIAEAPEATAHIAPRAPKPAMSGGMIKPIAAIAPVSPAKIRITFWAPSGRFVKDVIRPEIMLSSDAVTGRSFVPTSARRFSNTS